MPPVRPIPAFARQDVGGRGPAGAPGPVSAGAEGGAAPGAGSTAAAGLELAGVVLGQRRLRCTANPIRKATPIVTAAPAAANIERRRPRMRAPASASRAIEG